MPKKISSKEADRYKEKLELVKWLTSRGDKLRESTASRASIVVSADALLLAGLTFLVDKVLIALSTQPIWIQTILLSMLVMIILFIFLSLFYAATGIATIWNISPKRIDRDVPDVPVFNAFNTVEKFSNFSEFRTFVETVDYKQLFTFALGNFWFLEHLYYKRHRSLRNSLKFLIISIILLFGTTVFLLTLNAL